MLSRYLGLRYQGKDYTAKLALPANADDLTRLSMPSSLEDIFAGSSFFFSTR